jgi:hypothetical protein
VRQLLCVGTFVLVLAGCGESKKKEAGPLSKKAAAGCAGSRLAEAPTLPSNWPDMAEVTLTQQSTQGPTQIVEGYFEGDVKSAHDDFKRSSKAPASRSSSTRPRITTRRSPGRAGAVPVRWRYATSAARTERPT